MGMYISQDPIRIDGCIRLYSFTNNPNISFDILGLDTVYKRLKYDKDEKKMKPYVGSAKYGIKKRYAKKELEGANGKDVFFDLDHDSSRGLEQLIYEIGIREKGKGYWANKYNPVSKSHEKSKKKYKDNMDKYTYRTTKAKEYMERKFGKDWEKVIIEEFGF